MLLCYSLGGGGSGGGGGERAACRRRSKMAVASIRDDPGISAMRSQVGARGMRCGAVVGLIAMMREVELAGDWTGG